MAIRDATKADIEHICALIEEHARYEGNHELALDRDQMAQHLFGTLPPSAWVLLIAPPEQPEEVAGFAFCSWNFSTWAGSPGIWLDDLFIRPKYRRRGFGEALMNELRNRTSGRIEWDMHEENEKAAAFYARLGAQPVRGWIRYRWQPE